MQARHAPGAATPKKSGEVPAFLVSYPGSPRLSGTLASLREAGIEPEVIAGCKGSDLEERGNLATLENEFPGLSRIDLARSMLCAEADRKAQLASLGSYLSHIRCLRQIQSRNLDCALALEDDCLPAAKLSGWLPELARLAPLFDVLRLHLGEREFVCGPTLRKLKCDPGALAIHQFAFGHTGAIALLYSSEGVGRLLDIHSKLNKDYHLCFDQLFGHGHRRRLRYAFVRPSLALQNPRMASTIYAGIGNERYLANIRGWRTLRGRLARLWRWIRQLLSPHGARALGALILAIERITAFYTWQWRWRRQWRTGSALPLMPRDGGTAPPS